MHVTIVHVHVKPEHLAEFVESIRINHENSIKEPGNLRFDILRSVDDPTWFIAYEAYRDEAAAKAHKETAHYLAWRDLVADWMVEPRQGVRYDGLFPAAGWSEQSGRPSPATGGSMYVSMVYIHVDPAHIAEYLESIRVNHESSVKEPGNMRFDILQSVDDPTRFITYMAYRDEQSAKAHRETAHYRSFRDTVADWMLEERRNVRYDGLFPAVE